MDNPKTFISYSWTNTQHEEWVLNLAIELVESGVDVILDKWDLKEGHDTSAFMEKMVTDPAISKVIIVADKAYKEKADDRSGGVGTETQIISSKVYDNVSQDKFVVIVAEMDDQGKPYLPTYYQSRIYINLCDTDTYAENFDKLLRWIYDKPLYIRPEVGSRPGYLDKENAISLGTTPVFRRAIAAIKESKPHASGAMDEYLMLLKENMERFRLSDAADEFDDAVVSNIDKFKPYRDEFIQLVSTISHYAPTIESVQKLHRFMESLIPYMFRPETIASYRDWDFDNFRFIIHELFLYNLAILIKMEQFELANVFLSQHYYVENIPGYENQSMVEFIVFRQYMESLDYRKSRLNLNHLSLRATLLEERNAGSGIDFKHLIQADFVIFMRAEVEDEADRNGWWPETLPYLSRYRGRPFEIFARSISHVYFDRVKDLLGIDKKDDLVPLLESYKYRKRKLPSWESSSFNPSALLGYDQLDTKP